METEIPTFAQLQAILPGAVLNMVRKGSAGHVDWWGQLVVERTSPTRLFVSQNRYIDKRTGELKPKYLDYTTTVESISTK
jgi:hypothetical protein